MNNGYFLIIIALLLFGCASKQASPYIDVTHEYQLPPELKDHKILVLGGGWSGKCPLWVIVAPNGIEKYLIVENND